MSIMTLRQELALYVKTPKNIRIAEKEEVCSYNGI